VKLLASHPTPNLEDQGSLFVWLLPLHLSGMGDATSSYATAGIALRVSGALKPHHHDKVETPSVGICWVTFGNSLLLSKPKPYGTLYLRELRSLLMVIRAETACSLRNTGNSVSKKFVIRT
jgi:hypothetical protein